MDNKIKNEKNIEFLEILKNEESLTSKINQDILFITTDKWLAQLDSRKINQLSF